MAQQPVARLGDAVIGVCRSAAHDNPRNWTGVFETATAGYTADGIPVVRVGDTGSTSCGHTFVAIEGSSVLTGAGGIPVVRVGDAVEVIAGGDGTVISGSPTHTSE